MEERVERPTEQINHYKLLIAIAAGVLALSLLALGVSAAEEGEVVKTQAAKTDAEWRASLSPDQYKILRKKGTERAFSGKYWNLDTEGRYACAGCGQELFVSGDKFNSDCGWPSFSRPAGQASVATAPDGSMGMNRTEVMCSRCGGHLGHVFDDGPQPSGLRYCINSAALEFNSEAATGPEASRPQKQNTGPTVRPVSGLPEKNAATQEAPTVQTATFGAGCFWCTEAVFETIAGVKSVKAGYMGGSTTNPTYADVCSGASGHAEVIQVSYDPAEVTYDALLDIFWKAHDPTTLNRQGADTGTQYRSVIFFHNPEQRRAAEQSKTAQNASGLHGGPVVTEISPAGTFYEAEDYHQDYYRRNPSATYCRLVIAPKLRRLSP